MAIYSLLSKDVREHRFAALMLGAASLVVVMLLLTQNAVAAYSMSTFEIVRFALVTFLPLIALIVGNRLIVNEYLSGTRLFVEALPVSTTLPLLLKYILGFSYVSLIATVMVLLAALEAGVADDPSPDYIGLILVKTLVMVALYWSVVFCFSLCGHLRVVLYLIAIAFVMLLAYYPGIDATGFAPLALMDEQLFVYERDVVPLVDLLVTLAIAAAFTMAGFILTRVGEGSVVERLARPMTQRDYVALGILAAAGLALASTLIDDSERLPIDFSSNNVIRLAEPALYTLYLAPEHEERARSLSSELHQSLSELQAALSLSRLPVVRLALTPSREKHDFDYATGDGVFVSANWNAHDAYDDAVFKAVVLHGVLSNVTGGRAIFEPSHWVLDGFTRWWVERDYTDRKAHRDQLFARALMALERDPQAIRLLDRWQLTADRFSYASAEALAWAAMDFLEQQQGEQAVLRLAGEFLVSAPASSIAGTWRERRSRAEQRLYRVLQEPFDDFLMRWQRWLETQSQDPDVQALMAQVPALIGDVQSVVDHQGVHTLQAAYRLGDEAISGERESPESLPGDCILKHDYIGPFDTEYDVPDDYQDVSQCRVGEVLHRIGSLYASGDRVYVALDYEGVPFNQPVRLHVERLSIP